MSEVKDTGGHRRKRNGGGSSKKTTRMNPVTFLKLGLTGLAAGALAAVAPKVVDYFEDSALESQLHDFRKTLPTLPDNLLTADQEEPLKQEGWGEKFQRPFISTESDLEMAKQLSKAAAANALLELENKMRVSIFKPFSETVSYLNEFVDKDIPGKLTKDIGFISTDQYGGNVAYYTQISLSKSGYLETRITGNGFLFSPGAQRVEENILTKATWALGLDHEKQHHFLSLKIFDFWKGLGLSPQEALNRTLNDEGQEPFAYWNQGSATHKFISTVTAHDLPFAMVDVAYKWKKLSDRGVHWYDEEWSEFLNEKTVVQTSTNMPLKHANEIENSVILASKPISDFI